MKGKLGKGIGLGLLTLAYVFGEIAHFLIATTSKDVAADIHYGDQACLERANSSGSISCKDRTEENCLLPNIAKDCQWEYNGQGYQFQVLVGPAFVATFSTTLLVMGVAADNFNRPLVFAIGTLIFSVSCLLMGFADQYWHLVATRVGIALGEAACRPTASSLLADLFPADNMAVVNGIFSWGVYFGYALAFLFGLKMTEANLFDYGWRSAYILPGAFGILVAILIPILIRDPRSALCGQGGGKGGEEMEEKKKSWVSYFKALVQAFSQPEMLLLLSAAIFRHMAGLSWANNNVNFFNEYHHDYDIGYWLFACSIAGGSVGVIAGGLVTDLLKRRLGPHSRLWVQAAFLAAATPFAALTLHLDPPYCFITLMAYYFCAETWFAILFTVIVEIVPAETRAFCVGVFLFMMNMLAGNLAVLVKTAGESMGLREAMYVFFPGFIAVCAVLFFLAGVPVYLRNRKSATKT